MKRRKGRKGGSGNERGFDALVDGKSDGRGRSNADDIDQETTIEPTKTFLSVVVVAVVVLGFKIRSEERREEERGREKESTNIQVREMVCKRP